MARRKQDAKAQIKVRVREHLRARIEAEARKRDVSLNDEVVARLEASFDLERQVAVLRQQIEEQRELNEGGYQELAEEVKELREAIGRHGLLDDPRLK